MAIVAVHAFASLFAFYCIIDRGGLGKFAAICFFTGAFFLVPGLWKVTTGTVSPRFFYAYESDEAGYVWLIFAGAFLVFGMVAYFLQKIRERRG